MVPGFFQIIMTTLCISYLSTIAHGVPESISSNTYIMFGNALIYLFNYVGTSEKLQPYGLFILTATLIPCTILFLFLKAPHRKNENHGEFYEEISDYSGITKYILTKNKNDD